MKEITTILEPRSVSELYNNSQEPFTKSLSEKNRLENQRKESVRRIQRLDKKWTTIWIVNIFTYSVLGLIFACCGLEALSLGMIVAIILSGWFFYHHKLDIEKQMKKIEQMKLLEDRIVEEIKKQEVLEAKLAEYV